MLRGFNSFQRNSSKNPNAEEIENVPIKHRDALNPRIGIIDPLRPALSAIQDPCQTSKCISGEELASSIKGIRVDRTTPTKAKTKYSDTSKPLRTPEKQGILSRNRYGWAQKSEHPSSNGVVEPKEEAKVLSNMNTPRSIRGVGRVNSSHSEPNSTQNTPTKSVNKPPNPGFFLASGSRPPCNGGTRGVNFAALSKGMPSSCSSSTVVNTVEVPYFELKEDLSFWMEHNVQVLVRVRPLNNMEKSSFGFSRCLKQESSQCITWIGQSGTRFTFDHVACEAIDQETLFRMVGLPMVENCLSGYNSCMFAYGQTGSGKTYTMLGEIENLKVKPSPHRGMTPRIFEFLFARIREEEECRRDERLQYNCKCSFLEIYNEQIADLLDPSSTNLMLREDMKKGVYVENLSEFEVHSVGDILHLLSEGSSNRKVAATNMNSESSRSHSVFTCVIESKWEKDSTTNFRFARLNLVDLAGSERQKSSGAEGERLKEAANINRSLSTLGHVIQVLVDVANGRPKHVPYRDSRLTFLLQDSLGGNSKTVIIANVSPSICSTAETLNTLQFAQRAKLIQNNAVINEDSSGDVNALQLQIQKLKEELSALKHEKVPRSLSFGPAIHRDIKNKDEDGWNSKQEHSDNMLGKESNEVLRVSCKQLKSLETTLSGALRREQMAETSIKQLEAEIEQLNRLVSQREEDTRCTKMMLKFREDKIQRMESLLGGLVSADDYLLKENNELVEELQLLRARIEKNPEVTRFALENIRLLDQVRRFQDLYEEGEREMLMTEISELRNQLVLFLDANSKHPYHPDVKGSCNGGNADDSIQEEFKRTIYELEENKAKLTSCLNDNAKLRRELEELHVSLNAKQEHDYNSEVIKESIVEGSFYSNQSVATNKRDEKETCGYLTKQEEKIVDLQLELDVLKIILQEERSCRVGTEERVQSLNRELQLSKEMAASITEEYKNVQEELEKTKLVIEVLESQQIFLINEIEDLKLESFSLKNQSHGQELRSLSMHKNSESEDSPLEAKLKRMHASLEKAKRLNEWYQSGISFQASNDEEMEEVRKQVEAETAEVIVCLQEELSVLQREVNDSKNKEIETRERLVLLQTEMKVLENNLNLKNEENAKLAEMLQDKERAFLDEWEVIAGEIEGILVDGHEALEDVSDQIDLISISIPDNRSRISEQFGKIRKNIIEKDLAIERLNKCLQDAIDKRNDMECMLRSLRGAVMVMTETHQQECCEKEKEILDLASALTDQTDTVTELKRLLKHEKCCLRTASSCATAALVIVNRLSELNSNYKDALIDKNEQLRGSQEIIAERDAVLQNQASIIDEAHEQTHSLKIKLDASEECCNKLRLQLLEEKNNLEALRVKLEETDENNILETREKLNELNSGVSTLKLCMNECLKLSTDMLQENVLGKSIFFSTNDEHESRTDARTEQGINQADSCHLEDVTSETLNCFPKVTTSKDCMISDKNLASESSLNSMNSRDTAIILLKKEIESALRSLQQVQTEMAKLQSEKEKNLASEKHSQKSIGSLTMQTVLLQNTIDDFEAELVLKVNALDGKLRDMEENVKESGLTWYQQKELLEAELDDAKVVASQKTIEASCIFEKFGEVQDTMKEADIMINELMIANEALKLNAHELKVRENNLTNERDSLVNEVQSLKFSSNLKDEHFMKLEKQFLELEDIVSQVHSTSMEEFSSLASDFLCVKSQLQESTETISSFLEEVWSEIIVKDCAVSVLHLCHMGILLETANGLNVENGLLQHGLCESNSVISELREHNFRSKRELEICRVLKGKLLADIKKGFDRVSRKEDETGELTLQLTFFEKKIQDLQFQEEVMLQRSNDIASELAVLTKELDLSNREALTTIMDQELLLKDKDELLEYQEECFLMELCAKEFETVILSSEMSDTCISFVDVLENLKKDIIFKSLDASTCELMLLDKENKCAILKNEVLDANKALKCSFEETRVLSCRVRNLESRYEKLLEELKMKETAFETSSSSISELDQEIEKLQDDICLLEIESQIFQINLVTKDEELGRMNEMLQDQVKEYEAKHRVLLQELDDTKSKFESSLDGSHSLEVENDKLRDNISVLENSIGNLEEDLHQARVEMERYELSQSVENDLCLRIKDLETQLDNFNGVKKENFSLRKEVSARKISESEYLNALSLKSSDNVDLANNVDVISSKVLNLITKRFIEIDNMFQENVKEVEKVHRILEQFNNLENLLDSDIHSIQMELSRKDDIIKGLLFDLSLLQESTSNSKDQKDDMEELVASFHALEKDFDLKSLELEKTIADAQKLEAQLQDKRATIFSFETEIAKQGEIITSLSRKNCELLASGEDALEAKNSMEKELINMRIKCEKLEMEIAEMEKALARLSDTTESLKKNLDIANSQTNDLDDKVRILTEELDMARALAEENEAIAIEAREIAEFHKDRAEEKEEEIKLLERSIEELECTINVLEQKVDIVKGEAERQRLEREELELELHAVKEQMQNVKTNDSDIKRHLDEKAKNLQEALQRVQLLEREIAARDAEISQCKAHITELNFHAEAQACEYKQKFKSLEAMVEQVKSEVPAVHSTNSSPSKLERKSSKSRGSGSPFKCIGLGLSQQIKSEKDEELSAGRQRIEELEALASSRQKEILMLKARLASTESMTHDVIRDLLGVKQNMNNYATLMDNQQLHSLMKEAQHHNAKAEVKEQEVVNLKLQINEFIKERNGWLEEMERKQAEVMATHVALEKLRQRDQFHTTENGMLKVENTNHKKRVMELETEVKKLSGQQNIQQRIHHHAKIKEENNLLRCQNEDLSIKLRKTEAILSRVKEELAQFRAENGTKPYINFDEEQLLGQRLRETEEERLQLAQKLLGLCTTVLQAAGITRTTSDISPSAAEEALDQLKNRVISLELELQDVKLKNRISDERTRLSELRPQTSTSDSSASENCQNRNRLSQTPFLSDLDR